MAGDSPVRTYSAICHRHRAAREGPRGRRRRKPSPAPNARSGAPLPVPRAHRSADARVPQTAGSRAADLCSRSVPSGRGRRCARSTQLWTTPMPGQMSRRRLAPPTGTVDLCHLIVTASAMSWRAAFRRYRHGVCAGERPPALLRDARFRTSARATPPAWRVARRSSTSWDSSGEEVSHARRHLVHVDVAGRVRCQRP
jgi:hypothetical protein